MNLKSFIIILFLCFSITAQVFIPFGFWKGSTTPLSVSPSGTIYMTPQSIQTFTASGGTGSYNWDSGAAVFADSGGVGPGPTQTITGSPTDYLSRVTPYSANTLILTSGASTINITIQTYDPMSMSPVTATIAVSTTQQFTNTFGYCSGVPGACTNATTTWSIVSGLGSISASGLFTASATPGTTVIQAADSIGNTAQSTITVVSVLTITPATIKIPVFSTMNFTATLGTTPYTYSVPVGSGTVGCTTTLNGALTAATNPITVLSTAGCPTSGIILVESEKICYSGLTATTFTGTAFGGTTVLRGCNGTTAAAHLTGLPVNLNQTVYTAPSAIGSETVRVTDNVASTSNSAVTVIKPTSISLGLAFACAIYNSGDLKCWGENTNGQLGIGSTSNIGDLGSEVGGANAFVNLGAGRTATQVTTGNHHTCALLDNSTVKCWGMNTYGQLGIGSTVNSTSPALVSFGAKTPNNIWAIGYNTCASFTDNTATCWGYNLYGQTGNGNTTTPVNAPPAAMLNFGASRYPTKMVATNNAICALLNDATVQCWGDNNLSTAGQLGDGSGVDKTSPSQTSINLGAGRTAVDIAGEISSMTTTTSEGNFCAALDDGTVVCWGRNSTGQFGNGTTTVSGTPTASAAIGFPVSKIYGGYRLTCVKSTVGNYVRCWGRNTEGQLLIGSTTSQSSAATSLCKTTVTGAHTAGVTTITVGSTTNCTSTNGKVLIGTEAICYTGLTATTFTGVTRGCGGTTAAAYVGGEAVIGVVNFGTTVAVSQMAVGGKNGCIITGGGSANNDRIKCWGYSHNAAASASSGILLYHTTLTTTSSIGDAVGELGDNIPFVNH